MVNCDEFCVEMVQRYKTAHLMRIFKRFDRFFTVFESFLVLVFGAFRKILGSVSQKMDIKLVQRDPFGRHGLESLSGLKGGGLVPAPSPS